MFFRNDAPASKVARSKVDAAILGSVLAMGTLNLLVMADQIGMPKAYAASTCRCAPAGIALA